jgi:hypothetical protein
VPFHRPLGALWSIGEEATGNRSRADRAAVDVGADDLLACGDGRGRLHHDLAVGTADLSADVGLDAERFERRVAEIADVVTAAGVVLGAIALDDARVGYRVLSSDLALLRSAAAGAVRAELECR